MKEFPASFLNGRDDMNQSNDKSAFLLLIDKSFYRYLYSSSNIAGNEIATHNIIMLEV